MPNWQYTAWYGPLLPEVGNFYLLDHVTERQGVLEGTAGRPIRVEGFLARLKDDMMNVHVLHGSELIGHYEPAEVNGLTGWIHLGLELRDFRKLRMYMHCAPLCQMWARVSIYYYEV